MSIIINLVACSSKQNDQLIDVETSHIVELVDNGSIEISKEEKSSWAFSNVMNILNGLLTLPLFEVWLYLCNITIYHQIGNLTQRIKVDKVYDMITSFVYTFIFHFMGEMLKIINNSNQDLQHHT